MNSCKIWYIRKYVLYFIDSGVSQRGTDCFRLLFTNCVHEHKGNPFWNDLRLVCEEFQNPMKEWEATTLT